MLRHADGDCSRAVGPSTPMAAGAAGVGGGLHRLSPSASLLSGSVSPPADCGPASMQILQFSTQTEPQAGLFAMPASTVCLGSAHPSPGATAFVPCSNHHAEDFKALGTQFSLAQSGGSGVLGAIGGLGSACALPSCPTIPRAFRMPAFPSQYGAPGMPPLPTVPLLEAAAQLPATGHGPVPPLLKSQPISGMDGHVERSLSAGDTTAAGAEWRTSG